LLNSASSDIARAPVVIAAGDATEGRIVCQPDNQLDCLGGFPQNGRVNRRLMGS